MFLFLGLILVGCNQKKETPTVSVKAQVLKPVVPGKTIALPPNGVSTPDGMVWIPGGQFKQGAVPHDNMAMKHEKPQHSVVVNGFFMDMTEVTNAQFEEFVKATGYVTIAEGVVDWEQMKNQLPLGTEKPHDSILQPGSLVFKQSPSTLPNLYDFSQWWEWTIGANWRKPNGPENSSAILDNEPVVHIAYEDALAYCHWKGRRLPTEAEWEYAARGGIIDKTYSWGDNLGQLTKMANSWEGEFPVHNSGRDGFERRSPVASYPPNGFGLFDMSGNVWEWTDDWYNPRYYNELFQQGSPAQNPKGASKPYNPQNPRSREKVIRGGSFLCHASYCASYRVSSRMSSSMDSAAEHIGFRTVLSIDKVNKN